MQEAVPDGAGEPNHGIYQLPRALTALFARWKAKAEAVPLVHSDQASQPGKENKAAAPINEPVTEKIIDFNDYKYEL